MLAQEFGGPAVLGQLAGVGDLKRMHMALRIVRAYQSRELARAKDAEGGIAAWAERHPDDNELLNLIYETIQNEEVTHGD